MAKTLKFAISQSFLNRFGCFWARFEDRGYENADPYPDPAGSGTETRRVTRTPGDHYVWSSDDADGRLCTGSADQHYIGPGVQNANAYHFGF